MRRISLAPLAAVALLFTTATASVAAAPLPGILDQRVEPTADRWFSSSTLTQTITPEISGLLTRVELECGADGSATLSVSVGSAAVTGTCNGDLAWVNFVFPTPPQVVAGQQFTLAIDTGGDDAPWVDLGFTATPYSGGSAEDNGSPIVFTGDGPSVSVASFAFATFVLPGPTTTYSWNPTAVAKGVSTPATLTAVTVFPASIDAPAIAGGQPNGVAGMPFTLQLAALPAWFTPTGIECDSAITNCSLANFSTGLTGSTPGSSTTTVTVTVTGTANPPSTATSGSGETSGQGCETLGDDGGLSLCSTGDAVLGIVGSPTLPPTATIGGPSGGSGGFPWPLLWAVSGLLAAFFVAERRAGFGRR